MEKEKTTAKKISNFLIGLIFENKKVLFGFILILIGILLLAFFWEVVSTDEEELRNKWDTYKNGETIIFHGKIKSMIYSKTQDKTTISLESQNGFCDVYGDVRNDFKKGDDIFVFVKMTKSPNNVMTMQPVNKSEIYPSWFVDIWFYLITLIGIAIVLYNSKKLRSLLKREKQIQTQITQQTQPKIETVQQKQQISQTTQIKQEIQKPIEKKVIQEKTAKEVLQEMKQHIEKEKPKKKSKRK